MIGLQALAVWYGNWPNFGMKTTLTPLQADGMNLESDAPGDLKGKNELAAQKISKFWNRIILHCKIIFLESRLLDTQFKSNAININHYPRNDPYQVRVRYIRLKKNHCQSI